jgi:thiol-disulfide isomerase/thioredoxin
MLRFPVSLRLTSLAFALFFMAFESSIRAATEPGDTGQIPGQPTDSKARKTFANAIEYQRKGERQFALDEFRKANKQDGGHCSDCLNRAYSLAIEVGDLKAAESTLRELLPLEATDTKRSAVHFQLGSVLQREGVNEKKEKYFTESCDEFKSALQLDPSFALVHYGLGISLAHLHQDDTARAEFKTFLANDKDALEMHARAERYMGRVDLARAIMAPPFSLTALDGKHITMDSLAGKVVLIDFWATWCGPCREALPHIRKVAQKFEGQPLVVLSISLDRDEAKWKDFVAKNEMTWLQYRDGYFDGPIATRFSVNAIPATFSIDADGVLEDQHVGDASIEGKLKKMIAQATELSKHKPASVGPEQIPGSAN